MLFLTIFYINISVIVGCVTAKENYLLVGLCLNISILVYLSEKK